MYTIYANGRGQTYWGPAVNPAAISSISTVVNNSFSSLNSYISNIDLAYMNLSTSTNFSMSTLDGLLVSTNNGLFADISTVTYWIQSQTDGQNAGFELFTNEMAVRVNNAYTSTLDIVYSTINSIVTASTFIENISELKSASFADASTFSSIIQIQHDEAYRTLSTQLQASILELSAELQTALGDNISSISSVLINTEAYGDFSTFVIESLESSITTLTDVDASIITIYTDRINTIEENSLSSQLVYISTLFDYQSQFSSIAAFSTSVASNVTVLVSSLIQAPVSSFDGRYSLLASTLVDSISTLAVSTFTNGSNISVLSTGLSAYASTMQQNVLLLDEQLRVLGISYSTLTTSTILTGVWKTFNELEDYTSVLLISTFAATATLRSILTHSTNVYTASTTAGFLSVLASTFYPSSLGVTIPVATTFASSIVSTFLTTYNSSIVSALNSTTLGITSTQRNELSTVTNVQLAVYGTAMASSITGYLSTPAGAALLNFSTATSAAISTTGGQTVSAINTVSSFISSINSTNTVLNNLIRSTVVQLSTIYYYGSSYVISLNASYSTFVYSSLQTFATIDQQYVSTIARYTTVFDQSIASTNNSLTTTIAVQTSSVATVVAVSTLQMYANVVSSITTAAPTVGLSTLYTSQAITLFSTNFEAVLDLGRFRNFYVNISTPIVSGRSNYRITYALSNMSQMDYRRGLLTIDVNTLGSGYSNNNGRLALDFNTAGIPTSIFSDVYPSISSMNYTLMYEYNILNQVVYANLLNVFPRLRITGLAMAASQTYNVFVGNQPITNYFWRGSPIRVSWSAYSFFPLNTIGGPPLNAEIAIDVVYGNTAVRYGPYNLNQNTAVINMPYIIENLANPVLTTIRAFIVGKPAEAVSFNLFTLIPRFTSVRLRPAASRFLVLQDMDYETDSAATVTYIFRLESFLGVGWKGAIMDLRESTGAVVATFGSNFVDDLALLDVNVNLVSGRRYNLFWRTATSAPATWNGTVMIRVLTQNGGIIYTKPQNTGSPNTTTPLFTFIARPIAAATVSVNGSDPSSSDMSFLRFGGSMEFAGTVGSFISVSGNTDFSLDTGDFYIEWFQYTIPGGGALQNAFSVGPWPFNSIAFWFENVSGGANTPVLYVGGNRNTSTIGTAYRATAMGAMLFYRWSHFVISRFNGTLSVIVNAATRFTASISAPISDSVSPLFLGGDSGIRTSASASFRGYITNFHWVKGTSYTGTSVPTTSITANASSRLLMLATNRNTMTNDSSGRNKVPTASSITFRYASPFDNYQKENILDRVSNTSLVGPTTTNSPDSLATLELRPAVNSILSTITITNVATSCNIFRGGTGNGSLEMLSTMMTTELSIGGITYMSTIYLRNTTTQSFIF
jgi:hypothetical protein